MKKVLIICFLFIFGGFYSGIESAFAAGNSVSNIENKTPAVNFETKRAEIIETLGLSDKQQKKAVKIYTKGYNELAELNSKIENLQKEARAVKLSKIDTKTQLKRLSKIEDELNPLYSERDKAHNMAQRKFENILNKKQKKIWNEVKRMGARFFPETDSIVLTLDDKQEK